jgi:hypothetical protein
MKKWYVFILLATLIVSLAIGLLFNFKLREGIVNIDNKYLSIIDKPKDDKGNSYIPSGPPNYYSVNDKQMVLVPPGYNVTPDNMGIITTNPDDLIPIKIDDNGVATIPYGYYDTGSVSSQTMAIIPHGFKLYKNTSGNVVSSGITLNPLLNVINSSLSQNSPTANLTDNSYNDLIKYDSNNFKLDYHEDISMNEGLNDLGSSSIYYQPGAFKYGAGTYVPSYEDSVYLSKTTYLPNFTIINKKIPENICEEYKYFPNKLENACNNLDHKSCRNSGCCVLLGSDKCVAGGEQGPTFKYNYSDFTVKNRDYYYYKNKCYGNCPFWEPDMR